ncbi:hypothetical protein K525DRAFT_262443 [Schizophyllum commune Loenen D]|nr:hypothetical protein K525DRAFT_262443 [Schizophyllum commune Loenen D]
MFFTIFALFIASPMLVALLLSAAVPFAAAAPSFAAPPAIFRSRRAESDGPCVPQFNGVGVSVTNSAREWGVKQPPAANASVTSESSNPNTASMLAKVDFFFHPIEGDDDSLFTISPAGKKHLAVALTESGNLALADASDDDESQHWSVQCDYCNADSSMQGQFSYGCNITSVTNGQCVEIAKDAKDPNFLAPCAGIDHQNFDLWTKCDWC